MKHERVGKIVIDDVSDGEELWDVTIAAAYLGFSKNSLRNLVTTWDRSEERFRIPYYKIGGSIRFRKYDLDKWIEKCRV